MIPISPTISIALLEPRIPQNTGNIARTCAAFNFPLYLIGPLGFSLDDRYLKRAGLDYWKYVHLTVFSNFSEFTEQLPTKSRIIGFSKSADLPLNDIQFFNGDILLFGREDLGLPQVVKRSCKQMSFIPMPGGDYDNTNTGVRSLNLSVAVAIAAYQAGTSLKIW